MKIDEYKGILEGLLFVSGDEGLSMKQMKKVLDVDEETMTVIIEELKYDYEHNQRGLNILRLNNIYYLTTKPEHAIYYEKMHETNLTSRLSQASLETLAIVAYQQPITKVEMEQVRGVKCDGPVQTLISRFLIEECGRKETSGRPILYQTTKEFLTFFGLSSLEDLPPLPEGDEQDALNEANIFLTKYNEAEKNN